MRYLISSNSKSFNLRLVLFSSEKRKLIFKISDPINGNVYLRRKTKLFGRRSYLLKLPISPEELTLELLDVESKKPIRRGVQVLELDQTGIRVFKDELTKEDIEFLQFSRWVVEHGALKGAGEKGTIYTHGDYKVIYFDVIKDGDKELTTPARISHGTGTIELSKRYFKEFSIPMRLLTLLHEYAHKFKNHLYGRKIGNEISADLIALRIFLAIGFSQYEALHCYADIFSRFDSDLNRKRFKAIERYIEYFTNHIEHS